MPVDAALARSWVTGFADSIAAAKDQLTKLDQAIGDGDHGTNMSRGLTQAVAKLAGDTPGDVLKGVGRTLISTVGGAVLGFLIGQSYNGTDIPLTLSFILRNLVAQCGNPSGFLKSSISCPQQIELFPAQGLTFALSPKKSPDSNIATIASLPL